MMMMMMMMIIIIITMIKGLYDIMAGSLNDEMVGAEYSTRRKRNQVSGCGSSIQQYERFKWIRVAQQAVSVHEMAGSS